MTSDLDKLNSATKYPSIPTYHRLNERGVPTDEIQVHFTEADGPLIYTEKIDGVNARLIVVRKGGGSVIGTDWFIGSREELLTAKGDRVPNPAMGIVSALSFVIDRLDQVSASSTDLATGIAIPQWPHERLMLGASICVFYFEVFGGKTTAGTKQYTSTRENVGWRLFDIAAIDPLILARERDAIASWRDNGGQDFFSEAQLASAAVHLRVALTPRIVGLSELPHDPRFVREPIEGVLPKSLAMIDDGAGGRPEGVVVRTFDRKKIAKIRFEDYAKVRQT